MLTYEQRSVLDEARKTYGPKAQVAVSAEECCELAQALLKYLRYEEHDTAVEKLRNDVLTEVADVTIILDHVKNIFGLSDKSIEDEISHKISRLMNWLDHSSSLEYTTEMRDEHGDELNMSSYPYNALDSYPCRDLYKGCSYIEQGLDPIMAGICRVCSCNRSGIDNENI